MGFIVTQPVHTSWGLEYNGFYVRIEVYAINKRYGTLEIMLSHYENSKAAKLYWPDYVEDKPFQSPMGKLPIGLNYKGEFKDWPMKYTIHLKEPAVVNVETSISIPHTETIEYIDFDGDGNEIVRTREEHYETIEKQTTTTPKTLINIDLIDEDGLYKYAYKELKKIYADIFGNENIIDM